MSIRRGEIGWRQKIPLILAVMCLVMISVAAMLAPDTMSLGAVLSEQAYATPGDFPPLGADSRGRPLIEYAMQGSQIIFLPCVISGVLVMICGMFGGILYCLQMPKFLSFVQSFGEILGALPRMVVLLVVALILPYQWRGLLPLAITWALLCAPTAIDEAGTVAERLGGSRFVEALRAHGFSAFRIYLYHIVWLNLRPVLVRQGSEVMMQVVFLEISLSYLAMVQDQPSFTHSESMHSWAELLYQGYIGLIIQPIAPHGQPVTTMHILALGLFLIALVVVGSFSLSRAAEAR
jgi:ABC-type dipeptide/oligopeptide/nickel transport system permease subunit